MRRQNNNNWYFLQRDYWKLFLFFVVGDIWQIFHLEPSIYEEHNMWWEIYCNVSFMYSIPANIIIIAVIAIGVPVGLYTLLEKIIKKLIQRYHESKRV